MLRFADDVEVLSFSLAFPTRSVHADWMKSIVSGALEASRKLSGFSTPCKWKSTDCTLKVDLEYGFVLSDKNGRELWSKPYQVRVGSFYYLESIIFLFNKIIFPIRH